MCMCIVCMYVCACIYIYIYNVLDTPAWSQKRINPLHPYTNPLRVYRCMACGGPWVLQTCLARGVAAASGQTDLASADGACCAVEVIYSATHC